MQYESCDICESVIYISVIAAIKTLGNTFTALKKLYEHDSTLGE